MKKDPKYARRLLKLAAFLEKLPPERFNFGSWVGENWRGKQDLSCGTTACAMGWAATMRPFRRLGLRLIEWDGEGIAWMPGVKRNSRSVGPWHPSLVSAQRIFGLAMDESENLFTYDSGLGTNPLPGDVARHIRAFVKRETGRV